MVTGADRPHSRPKLDATLTSQRSEGVPGKALRVQPRQHRGHAGDVTLDQGEVDRSGWAFERVRVEDTVRRWHGDPGDLGWLASGTNRSVTRRPVRPNRACGHEQAG